MNDNYQGAGRAVRFSPGSKNVVPLRRLTSFLRSLSAACSTYIFAAGSCHFHPWRAGIRLKNGHGLYNLIPTNPGIYLKE